MQASESVDSVEASARVPLVIDLDGTLIRSDLLVESVFAYLGVNSVRVGGLLAALFRGKAAFKAHIAASTEIDVGHLPYDSRVIELIREARASGRPVYLASASNERYVSAVAAHLDLFDNWFASTVVENLSSTAKANKLVETFGKGGFDYVGNDAADMAVWGMARRRVAVQPAALVRKHLLALDGSAIILHRNSGLLRSWIKLLRIYQWAKNALVFVPLLTSQHFDLVSLGKAAAGFVALSLAASGIYLINDLVDLDADRKNDTKKHRPLAAGTVPVRDAMIFAPVLVAAATAFAFQIAPWFGAVLICYLALTTAYTFVLKRKMMIDVVALAFLYTLRVIGGAAAIAVPVSEWLLAFSMFIFTSLALIKRYTELIGRLDGNLPESTNRNYRKIDLDIVAAMAAAAGFNAVTVFTLYAGSETARSNYASPQLLWLVGPVLMYWIGRTLMLAHRRQLHDDPIVFALRDANSLLCAVILALVFSAAVIGVPFDILSSIR